MAYILTAALVFGICYLIDKVFTKTMRGKQQHKTGLSVRYSKRFAIFGLLLTVLGIMGLTYGIGQSKVLVAGGSLILLTGAGLIGYYMTFGIYYDADSFILSTFGKGSRVYRFQDIRSQQLYLIQGGSVVIELMLSDGQSVSLQSSMEGVYPFLDHAFSAWCRQNGRDPGSCQFHDPSQSKWFPMNEEA